jgi:hypothetical protein
LKSDRHHQPRRKTVPKFYQTPIPVGHWNADVGPTFRIVDTMGTIVLEAVPTAATPLELVLPPNPSDGDWYEWCDPKSLVGPNYPLTCVSADARRVQGGPSIGTKAPGGGFKVVFSSNLNMWCLVTSNPCPFS